MYELEDAEKLRKSNSKSFKLLSRKERCSLRAGDFAKLLFLFDAPPGGERMWVRVEVRDTEGAYIGFLSNKPDYAPGLKLGDVIVFKPENVLSIIRGEEAKLTASEVGNVTWTHETCNDPKRKTRCWGPEDN